jgi:hypothetical protein
MIDMTLFAKNFRVNDSHIITGYGKYEKKINRYINFDFNFGYVLGSYLSVGSVNISHYKNSYRGIVFWYVPRNLESKIEILKNSLKSSFLLDLIVREQLSSSTFQLVCYSKPLAEFFSFLGKKSGRKRLPTELFNPNSKDYTNGLISGIEDFEGYLPDTRNVLNKRFINIEVIELYNVLKNY